jgi:hypothetical protein
MNAVTPDCGRDEKLFECTCSVVLVDFVGVSPSVSFFFFSMFWGVSLILLSAVTIVWV